VTDDPDAGVPGGPRVHDHWFSLLSVIVPVYNERTTVA